MSKLNLIGTSKKNVTSEIDLSSVEGVIMFYTDRIIKEAKDNLRDSNASYELSQSIGVDFELVTTQFGQSYTATITAADYWQWVDQGRGPGKRPPITSIVQWIRDKESFQLRGKERIGDTKKRGLQKGQKVSLQDVIEGAAYGIATNIGKHGTQGTQFMSKVLTEEFYAELNRDMTKAFKRDIEVTIGAWQLTQDGKEFKKF